MAPTVVSDVTPAAMGISETEDKTIKKGNDADEEVIRVETEAKTGVSFPIKLSDGKMLSSTGARKKTIMGLGIKIYGFGMYVDNSRMKEVLKGKMGDKPPTSPTNELYQLVIDSDVAITVKMVIVYGSLTMKMVKKNYDEGLGSSIKKLNEGRKSEELSSKVMGNASDDIKLPSGSEIEISRLPGYGELISSLESELLCRAYMHLYLGDDPFDKEAKEKFGLSMLSLF
ncbi:hypothetical protein Sjap_016249 [Stephania japonica]|uniref:Chalcone isomerase n=1 Tax=Stephania japonica TaxID=461633 RepID=A0AAP0IMN2_9MAGN